MKKIFNFLFVAILVAGSILGFSACSCTMQPEKIDITTSLATKQNYLLTEVYNKTAGTDFNDEESLNYVEDADYYVTVKNDVVDILTSIYVAGIEFTDDETVSLSVGNNNFLIRNAWKLEDGSLMIVSGLLLSSINADGKIPVTYGGKKLSLLALENPTDINFDVTITGNNSTITGPTGGEYTYTSSNYAGNMRIRIANASDENILTANSTVTVQKIKKDTAGNLIGMTYALSKADLIGDEYYIIFYPAYNAGEAYTAGDPADFKMEFKFTVVGVGADSFTFNFVNSAT